MSGGRPGGAAESPRPECKLHRRKLHKKLLHQMQELEAARRGIQVALEEQQVILHVDCILCLDLF